GCGTPRRTWPSWRFRGWATPPCWTSRRPRTPSSISWPAPTERSARPLHAAIGIAVPDMGAEEPALGRRRAEIRDHLRRHVFVFIEIAADKEDPQPARGLIIGEPADDGRRHGA